MSSSLPVLVLVPGAFGTPEGFAKLLPYLAEVGITTQPGGYPSADPEDPLITTCANDIAYLRDHVLLPLLDGQQKDVVLLTHSYGGVVGGGASKGLDRQTRTAGGHKTSVVGLIYVAGNITLEGESLLQAVGGAYPPFIKLNKPSPNVALIEPHMVHLYNDCDASQAEELAKAMVPHANLAFETPPSAPGWADAGFQNRRVYVHTLDDACNPASLQQAWLAKSEVKWEVVDFPSGHMPMVSKPKELAAQIAKSVGGFVSL
ncbi:alpha/beta-hydrolase [Apiospora marii]|uniref:Alpha/beta-hydrolase n=1 Tax=Apiospora marii TaxID=335849 RepID=A0ABR1SA88_9PEZI